MSSASRALDQRIEALRSVSGCVTRARLTSVRLDDRAVQVRFQPPAPLRSFGVLRASRFRVRLALRANPDPSETSGWRVETRSYAFEVPDRNGTEVLAYHWHPDASFRGPDLPHLHVSAPIRFPNARGDAEVVDLDKRHLPTGPVTLAAVVRMLIEEFGAQSLVDDWQRRLDAAEPSSP